MSDQRKVKTRIQNKCDTPENWNKATNFVPLKGEVIISDYYSNIYESSGADETLRKVFTQPIKVGDGLTALSDLPYTNKRNAIFVPNAASAQIFPEDMALVSVLETANLDITYATSNDVMGVAGVVEAGVETTQKLRLILTNASNIRDYDVALNFVGTNMDNRNASAGNFHIQDLYTFMKPAKCLFDNWTVSDDTVINNSTNQPVQVSVSTNSDYSMSNISYTIHMPKDLNSQNNYVYNKAMLEISFTATPVLASDGTGILLITIENELYLDY